MNRLKLRQFKFKRAGGFLLHGEPLTPLGGLLLVAIMFGLSATSPCAARSGLELNPSVPVLADLPNARIEDWFGERQARISIASGNSATTVVIADDLDLSHRNYKFTAGTCPKNVVIVANIIRLSAPVSFDLSPTEGATLEDRSGGTLVVLARTFRLENNAFVYFNGVPTYFLGGNKNEANRFDWHTSPASGSVHFSFEKLELSPDLHEKVVTNILGSTPELLPNIVGEPLRDDVRNALLAVAATAYSDPAIREAVANLIRSKTVFDNDLIDIALYLKARTVDQRIAKHAADVIVQSLLSAKLDDPDLAPFEWMAKPIPGAVIPTDKFEEQYARIPALKAAVSKWVVRWFSQQLTDARSAVLHNDKPKLYDIYTAIEHFPSYPIDGGDNTDFQKISGGLITLRATAKLALYSKTVTVNLGGTDLRVDSFGENNATQLSIMPTNVLIQNMAFENQRYVGVTSFDPASPSEVTFYLTAALSVDPEIAAAVAKALQKDNQKLLGKFSNWRVKSVALGELPGLMREKSSVEINGSTIRAALVFDTLSLGALGLVIFSSQAGIPLEISWEYGSDPNYGGVLRALAVSRVTRAEPAISYANGSVRNDEKYPVQIRYLKVGPGEFSHYATVIPTIQPGASAPLDLPSGVNKQSVSIPPEAVEVSYEKPREYLDFYPLHGEQLAEQVTLQNEIDAADSAHPSRLLTRVDIKLTYETGDPAFKQVWNTSLAYARIPGAQQSRWFLRPKQTNPSITIQGTAIYSDNSTVDIPPKTFNVRIIHVTGGLLSTNTQ